jgi:hypothetical protein
MGPCNLLMMFQLLASWRHVEVTERRSSQAFAQCMKSLVDEHFPQAELIRVMLDNLNTHTPDRPLYDVSAGRSPTD